MPSLFHGPSKPPPIPTPIPTPIVMPQENSQAIATARLQQAQMAAAQSGRASTILNLNNKQGTTDTLG